METDEYIRLAELAKRKKAHVAVITNYRSAAELTDDPLYLTAIVMASLQHARTLKKDIDQKAVALWGIDILYKTPRNNLTDKVEKAIIELR